MTRTATPPPSVAKLCRHITHHLRLGKKKVVLARFARNQRLADAIYLWACATLTTSPGAQAFHDVHRAAGDTHHAALRALGNRLVASSTAALNITASTTKPSPGATAPRTKSAKPLDKLGPWDA
jgi:hypothetical protein